LTEKENLRKWLGTLVGIIGSGVGLIASLVNNTKEIAKNRLV
jgi:hypothetical protein